MLSPTANELITRLQRLRRDLSLEHSEELTSIIAGLIKHLDQGA